MRVVLTILMVLFSGILVAQYKQDIRGVVTDKASGATLPAANVALINGAETYGASTSENGAYEINEVPVGRYDLVVRYVGYEPFLARNIELNSGKEKVVDVELTEQVVSVEEVTVKAFANGEVRNKMAAVSSRSFSVNETERYAGGLGDPSRMASNFAGVITANDSRNDIIIRGNSPQGLLWRIEGVTIPNPNHFGALGSTGGPVSIINNNVLTNSDFFTGAFPAEYGNALSGVFDLKMRNGNNREHEFTGQIGFGGFELGAEGPLSKNSNASYMVNYRYSVPAVMDKIGFSTADGGVPEYQDLTFRLNMPTKRAGTFSVFGIAGDSEIEFSDTGEEGGTSYDTSTDNRTVNGSRMGVAALTHRFQPNDKSSIYSTLSATYQKVGTTIDTLKDDGSSKIFFAEENSEIRYSASSEMSYKFNARNTLKAGFDFQNFRIDYRDSITGEAYDPPVEGYISNLDVEASDLNLFEAFGEWQHRLSDNLTFYGGLHFQHFFFNNSKAVDPRFSVSYHLPNRAKISLAYGKHAQVQPFYVYFSEKYDYDSGENIRTNTELDFTQAHHLVAGYNHNVTENMKLKFEAYYQHVYDVPVEQTESYYSLVNSGNNFYQERVTNLVNDGLARNYGAEITLERYLNDNYYFLVTTSLFDSKYKPSDGVWRNTEFNTNYVVNALGGYEVEVGEHASLDVNMRVVTSGGKRTLFIDLEESVEEGATVYDHSKAYSERGEPYFRLDGRVAFKLQGKRITQEWALDITNLTGHQNVYSKFYNSEKQKIDYVYQQGFYPMMLYRINF
ncbi:MAG: TonB-dependent receptor [Prolixibacteraceae bacterium]|nr:TonB-dependent receptor [Prolixibacteraceae bacterium]